MVWSDPQIIKLSTEFVTVADEVYLLYPEDQWNLNRVKDDPAHLFFKRYGESMPKGHWNHPGTKQGIYLIGPNAEYLEGIFAGAADPADILARMKRGLARWEALRKEKSYANQVVPPVKPTHPPEIVGGLIFRVNSRDLPRGAGDRSGRRITESERTSKMFLDYIQWAWNESWVGVESHRMFIPGSNGQINQQTARHIAKTVLLDNVRGQNPEWQDQDLKRIEIRAREVRPGVYAYSGDVDLQGSGKAYQAKCYGEGTFDAKTGQFTRLDLVWLGQRRGGSQFNRREQDPGPAPMGISMSVFKN